MAILEDREQVLLAAPENYLVIDIGCIHNELDREVRHDSADNVGGDVILGMAQMGIFVHCRATHGPCHLLSRRDKVILAPRQAIVDFQFG